jgi:hypothetical protein
MFSTTKNRFGKSKMLSLSEAIKKGQLDQFVAQQEAAGLGPIDRAEFDGAVAKTIKVRRLEDRTSRSAGGGNSSGTKTTRDTDQGASG